MFTDVNESLWYGYTQQKVIANAYEYGLMVGSGGAFNPTGNMTIAEALTIAARVHGIYMTGAADFTQGSPWYQVYVDYCVASGIIKANDFTNYSALATRAQMAYIFAGALPQSEFKAKNTVISLPDVDSDTPYRDAIVALYEAGVLTGNAQGAFFPSNNINRAEAAAIISRVTLPSTQVSGKTYG